jgi:hypothetical protein
VVSAAGGVNAARRSAATTHAEQDGYQRQIEATGREIGALVSELRPERWDTG